MPHSALGVAGPIHDDYRTVALWLLKKGSLDCFDLMEIVEDGIERVLLSYAWDTMTPLDRETTLRVFSSGENRFRVGPEFQDPVLGKYKELLESGFLRVSEDGSLYLPEHVQDFVRPMVTTGSP